MRARAIASLRGNRDFRLLWTSNLFFFAGAWTQTLVLGWLAFETTRSEFLVAVFTAVRLAPMLLGPVSGAIADRYDRLRLLLLACGWAVGAVGLVAVLASAGWVPFWVLLVGGLAIGLAQSPSQPARSSLVLDLVGRRNLSNANALNALAMNMTQVIGPALGGAMISMLGAPAALWISTGWYAVSLVLLLPLRGQARTSFDGPASPPNAEPVLRMVTSGFRAIVRNRLACAVLLVTLAANTLLWPIYQGFMPVFADKTLGLDAAGLGWLLTCGGLGGLAGSLAIAAMGDFRFKGGVFVVGTALWGSLWALFGLSQHVLSSFLLMGLIGVASAAFGVLQTTLLLLVAEPSLHGRILGVQELAIGIMPIASLGLGLFAQAYGIGPTTTVSGLILVLFLGGLAARVPQLLRFSGTEPAAPPSPAGPGPVLRDPGVLDGSVVKGADRATDVIAGNASRPISPVHQPKR